MGGNHNTLTGAFNAVKRKLDTIPTNIAEAVKRDSESVTPVRTGTLKKGYEIKRSSGLGDDAITSNNVRYAGYVEFGTSKMAPRAMMRTAVTRVSPDASKYVG